MRSGVANLWNSSTQSFDWAVGSNGARSATVWSNLYSDALQQAWAVAFNLVAPSTATSLLARFEYAHRSWDEPTATAVIQGHSTTVGYWAPVGWAYLRVGNRARAASAATRMGEAAIRSGRTWPFTPADAGQLIVIETEALDLVTA